MECSYGKPTGGWSGFGDPAKHKGAQARLQRTMSSPLAPDYRQTPALRQSVPGNNGTNGGSTRLKGEYPPPPAKRLPAPAHS